MSGIGVPQWKCHAQVVWAALVLAATALLAPAAPAVTPGASFTVTFPEMPPTLYAVFEHKDVPARMTVFLPTNYVAKARYPLLVWLGGWDGGAAGNPGVPRGICRDRDFVCVSVPLFKSAGFRTDKPNVPGSDFIMTESDGRYMWPLLKTMLANLGELVPNLEPSHRVLGGFSNGAHAAAALIDGSDGEVTERFSTFIFVEGGGRLQHYERLKGRAFLMVSSNAKSAPRAGQIRDAASAAGARATLIVEDVGKHDFPASAYPRVREWLLGPGLQ